MTRLFIIVVIVVVAINVVTNTFVKFVEIQAF